MTSLGNYACHILVIHDNFISINKLRNDKPRKLDPSVRKKKKRSRAYTLGFNFLELSFYNLLAFSELSWMTRI